MNSYVVIGLGRFGSEFAKKLYEYGKDVLAIDRNQANVEKIADKVTRAATADAKNFEVLKNLGVADCDCAIIAVGSDFATSVLATMNLKKLGVPKVVCKASDNTHREILEKLGADEIISPEKIIAEKTARMLAMSDVFERIDLSKDYGVSEIDIPESFVGKTIKDLAIRSKYGITVIAISDGDEMEISPHANCVLEQGKKLVLLGKYDDLYKAKKIK